MKTRVIFFAPNSLATAGLPDFLKRNRKLDIVAIREDALDTEVANAVARRRAAVLVTCGSVRECDPNIPQFLFSSPVLELVDLSSDGCHRSCCMACGDKSADARGEIPVNCRVSDRRVCKFCWNRVNSQLHRSIILAAIEATAAGLQVNDLRVSPVCERNREPAAPEDSQPDLSALTRRETEIYALIYSEGASDFQLARKLSISAKTVGHHVSSILMKLGYESRHEIHPHRRNEG